MSLFCELGWHKAERLPRWNHGYYFSKCRRCRRDLVRTAYGGWVVPKGFRVVWQPNAPEPTLLARSGPAPAARGAAAPSPEPEARADEIAPFPEAPPAAAPAVAPAPEAPPPPEADLPEAPPPEQAPIPVPAAGEDPPRAPRRPSQKGELPIQEVLRHMEREAAAEPAPPPVRAAAERIYPSDRFQSLEFDDFMDEPGERSWIPDPSAGRTELDFGDDPLAAASERADASPFPAAPAARARRGGDDPPFAHQDRSAKEPTYEGWALTGGMLVLGLLAIAILTALLTRTPPRLPQQPGTAVEAAPGSADYRQQALSGEAGGAPRSAPEAAGAIPSPMGPAAATVPVRPVQWATVTASIVNCRADAAPSAPLVRKMVRGARIQVLERRPGWLHVAYRDKRCWIAGRYTSGSSGR